MALLPALNEVPWSDIEAIGGEVLARLEEAPSPKTLVDLTPLNYMGSAQVALVVRIFKAVKDRGGQMIVANSDPMVREVLTLAGLDKIWTIVISREAGLLQLGASPAAVALAASSAGRVAPGTPMSGQAMPNMYAGADGFAPNMGYPQPGGANTGAAFSWIALGAAVVGALFAVMVLANLGGMNPSAAWMIAGGAGAVAFISGVIGAVSGGGGSRGAAIAGLAVGLLLLIGGLIQFAQGGSAPAATTPAAPAPAAAPANPGETTPAAAHKP